MNYKCIFLSILLLPVASYGKSVEAHQEFQLKNNEPQECLSLLRAVILAQIEQVSEADSNAAVLSIEEAVRLCSKCCTKDRLPKEDNAVSALNNTQDVIAQEKLIKRSVEHAAYPKGCEPDRDRKKADNKAVPTLDQVACGCHEDFKAQGFGSFR
ncbi:MAG: hypothetical protein P4L31_06345 [Candidatus Babeliales bacterium]|nr:hypothetical protein [Candidatus Babeliales bacterium]